MPNSRKINANPPLACRRTRGEIAAQVATGAVTLWLFSAAVSVARACPDCDIGRVARNQFWTDSFASNLAVALAPFLFIVVVSLWAERSWAA